MGNNSTTCISIYADTRGTYRVRRVWCIYYTTWVSKYIMFTIGAERVFQRQRAVFQFGREPKRERKEENTTERREMRSERSAYEERERDTDNNQRAAHLYNFNQPAESRYRCVTVVQHQISVSAYTTVSNSSRIAEAINKNSILQRTSIQHDTTIIIAVNISAYGEHSYNQASGTVQNSLI